MSSSATAASLRARLQVLLQDAGAALWDSAALDEGLRLALEEYSRARPLKAVGTLTGAAGREQSLNSLAGLLDVEAVWFPYAASDYPPNWCAFEVIENGGAFSILLDCETAPQAGDTVRIFFLKPQTLNGIAGATVTTYPVEDDSLLVIGGAGYALYMRSIELNETAGANAVSTPNYGELAARFLQDFRAQLELMSYEAPRIGLLARRIRKKKVVAA